ncbi:FRG domain-containing protein [Paenibacillus alginolyticus]|uniref:FRG domain-containing protein n=1 Tax=Paenibacillus alginolyticus TaxID=59839 RepID=UPI0003F51FC4|nr:FRG domain-containing protein [Paenibacillus alginolyticus]MCY9664893.1 FRG domain-containing protein [Paenibacillus alginolyticus]
MWHEYTLKSWAEYEECIFRFSRGKWIFRGQANSGWQLESSLYREFSKVKQLYKDIGMDAKIGYNRYEMKLLREFTSSYNLYSNHKLYEPESSEYKEIARYRLEAWSLMQHHGAPTRLIDWTFSPYVAAFFALDGATDDYCIYALNPQALKQVDDQRIESAQYDRSLAFSSDKTTPSFVRVFEPFSKSERIRRQQGLFLVPNRNNETLSTILESYNLSDGKIGGEGMYVAHKFVFPKRLILDSWDKLQQMNINHETIYAGLDGFSRSLKLKLLDHDFLTFSTSESST